MCVKFVYGILLYLIYCINEYIANYKLLCIYEVKCCLVKYYKEIDLVISNFWEHLENTLGIMDNLSAVGKKMTVCSLS